MSGFDAGKAVEPLAFTLEPDVPGCSGVIPEPSQEAIDKFYVIVRDLPAADDANDVKIARLIQATSELCGGVITPEQLAALPYRKRIKFNEWLSGQLTNPTSGTSATTS